MFLERFVWRPLRYSLDGLAYLLQERAFREELLVGGILWGISFQRIGYCTPQALLTLAWGLVLLTEALNSAIESLVNLLSPRKHSLAKRAKDIGSAAVFIAVLSGLGIFAFCLNIPVHG
ncbi:MAG: diacylglycerol kinase [Puniceicoccales bacterium]|jgi:diacylglycerol kinase (ATP)|nr:diacylglycerol kinase [Puniceicoccales bacterium]